MQFIETSVFGVRAARLTFASSSSTKRVTLLPMVHVGDMAFYEATYDDALGHDVVLMEGLRSPIAVRVTRSYRWLVGSRAMAGLVVQPRLTSREGRARLVQSDLTAEAFAAEWRAVPLWQRVLIYALAPVTGLYLRWFSSRRGLAKQMHCEDQPSLAELLAVTPESGAVTQAILHARDESLLQHLRAELDAPPGADSVAIIYGAAHMRAVVQELTRGRGFQVVESGWRTLMAFDN